MSETVPQANLRDQKQSRAIKLAGRSSITLFVVFVIVLLTSFGRAPSTTTGDTNGFSTHFDFLSCLGIALGVYALFFLLLRFRTVMKLGTVKKVLGLVGGVGLIAHSVIAILIPLGSASPQAEAVGAGGNPIMTRMGPEDWVIDGSSFHINGSYLMNLPEGLQYTIEYPCEFGPSGLPKDNSDALPIAFPLMKHAYEQGLYKRMHVAKIGAGEMVPSRIGVVLFRPRQDGKTEGFRSWLSVDDIKNRIEQKCSAKASESQPSR